jgi:hypothetical protein
MCYSLWGSARLRASCCAYLWLWVWLLLLNSGRSETTPLLQQEFDSHIDGLIWDTEGNKTQPSWRLEVPHRCAHAMRSQKTANTVCALHQNGRLLIHGSKGTDFWRETYYDPPFITHSGHVLYLRSSEDAIVEVSTAMSFIGWARDNWRRSRSNSSPSISSIKQGEQVIASATKYSHVFAYGQHFCGAQFHTLAQDWNRVQ